MILDKAASDTLLTLCKASAEAIRLDIMRVLREESFGVMELCQIFDMPQPGMSHHLKILHNAGLLETRREGNAIFYRRALINQQDPLGELQHSLFRTIDQITPGSAIIQRIQAIHDHRATSSRRFFEKNAHRFKENQDLIVQFKQYAGCVADLLSNESMDPDGGVIEVGPGDSDLILHLAVCFRQVLAIDNSSEMLDKARRKAQKEKVRNVDFLQGELEKAADQSAHLVVLNMVLHHMASPARLFETAARVLCPLGRLLIIDLCPHGQEWVREICGDVWLGFEPDDLDDWGLQAAFRKGQSIYLGLKNGFQVQIRMFNLLPDKT